MKQVVQWGGPFTGYVSSVRRNRTPAGALTGDSRDVWVDPTEGVVSRRGGSAIVGDTDSAGSEVTGLLAAKWSARPRRMFSLESPSLSGGYPTHAVLYGRDNARESDGGEIGHFGTVYLRNGSTNQQVLSDYSSTHYPTASGIGAAGAYHNYKVVPWWYDSGDGGYSRGATELTRRFLAAGARDVLETANWLFLPNLYGTPVRWGKRINPSTATGNENVRVFPTGPVPPLWCPEHTATSGAVTDGTGSWKDGDTFYLSVLFQMDDGSYTMPAIPRQPNSTLTSGRGYVVVGTITGTAYYRTLTYAVPLGPEGTVARVILRSPKVNRATAATPVTVATSDLRICGVIRNNTQTTYEDSLGNDAGLLEDGNVVRFDHVMPRRSRYLFTGDQRAVSSWTLPNQCAIMLAPLSTVTERDMNVRDTSVAAYSNGTHFVRVNSASGIADSIDLYSIIGVGNSTTSISGLSGKTLQQVVDEINATTMTAAPKARWCADIMPGADPNQLASALCPTTWGVANCTASGTTLTTANSFDSIPVGYLVTGAGVSANTYVASKQSSTSLTLSQAATSSNVTLTFSADTGDGAVAAAGYMRAFNPAYPVMLAFRRSALGGYDSADKQSVYFTVASPGVASSGQSLAPNSWVAGNRRQVESRLGVAMGGCDIEGAAVVGFSRGVRLLINVRGVNTGEDFDIRLLSINERRGMLAPPVSGDGWAVYATPDGILGTDKNRYEKSLSGAIHNPANSRGDLAYEIGQCRKAVASDAEDAMLFLGVMGSQLSVAYRSSADATTPDRRIVYDFSPGVDASGLEELFDMEAKRPYPWSAPYRQKCGPFCEVVKSDGPHRYTAPMANAGATGDGRVQEVDIASSTNDDSASISGVAYLSTMFRPDFAMLGPQRLHAEHYTYDSSVTLACYRNVARTATGTLTLPPSSDAIDSTIIELPQALRANDKVVEWKWTDASGTAGSSLWKVALETETPAAFK